MNVNEQLGQAVADGRQRRGMSQSALARVMQAAGFSWQQTTVSRTEAGQRPIPFAEAVALAALLNIDLSEFKVALDICEACFNAPPGGFTCNDCGRSS